VATVMPGGAEPSSHSQFRGVHSCIVAGIAGNGGEARVRVRVRVRMEWEGRNGRKGCQRSMLLPFPGPSRPSLRPTPHPANPNPIPNTNPNTNTDATIEEGKIDAALGLKEGWLYAGGVRG
jgi:hypothetical protein